MDKRIPHENPSHATQDMKLPEVRKKQMPGTNVLKSLQKYYDPAKPFMLDTLPPKAVQE